MATKKVAGKKAAAVKGAAKKLTPAKKSALAKGKLVVVSSRQVYAGNVFHVVRDHVVEPGGAEVDRDVVRHNGSVVILAVDPSKNKRDPWIVMERQYRHAAGQFLWELPAGKIDPGEKPLAAAKRELIEETGYRAKKWSKQVRYYASPGFLGEAMQVFVAEGLVAGEAQPEDDEKIELRLIKLSEVLAQIDAGKILDGKTLISVLLYARQIGVRK